MLRDTILPEETTDAHTPVHPALFTILIMPMGVMSGYVSVTLAYLFSKGGITVEKVAALKILLKFM